MISRGASLAQRFIILDGTSRSRPAPEMPPPLSLSSIARSPSLNRRSRGQPSSATSEAPSLYGDWSHFSYYTGERSQLPCAKRALIVGIEYWEGQLFLEGGEMLLPGCHADAADVLDLLRNEGGYPACDIRILADVPGLPDSQRPTRENIVNGLRWLSDGCRSGDRRFFHYAGHGTQAEDTDGDETDGLDEAIQPVDWATKYQHSDKGLIIDDTFRDLLVDPLPPGAMLTALVDCCHSGTILDMDQEFRVPTPNPLPLRVPMSRGSMPSVPVKPALSILLKMKICRSSSGEVIPVGNILELPERAQVKSADDPVTPGAERSPITASDSVVLEMKKVESPILTRRYHPIMANVVCWSACLDTHLAYTQINEQRGVLTSAFTRGYRGAAANYNAMPGAFHPEHRTATYAELFEYIRDQDRLAYNERLEWANEYTEFEITVVYQQPQLWISASMGDIMDRPVIL